MFVSFATIRCGIVGNGTGEKKCIENSDCLSGQLCYKGSCRNSNNVGFVVEVGGSPPAGLYVREVPIPDSTLGVTLDFNLSSPLQIAGQFLRKEASDNGNNALYRSSVLIRAIGASVLIPGNVRNYEQRFENGSFVMNVGTGRYNFYALPRDSSVPPAMFKNVLVTSNTKSTNATFTFSSAKEALMLSGRLVKRIDRTKTPHTVIELDAIAIDIQALEPQTNEMLSHRLPVLSKSQSNRGEFELTLNAQAKPLASISLHVGPREANVFVPTKLFQVSPPFLEPITLEFGDFGGPVRVLGQVLDADDAAVVNAQVMTVGGTLNGGHFRSPIVTTQNSGLFDLKTLAHPTDKSLRLIVIPPATSSSAFTSQNVTINAQDSTISPSIVRCKNRVVLRGQVVQSDDTPITQVKVQAIQDVTSEHLSYVFDTVEAKTDAAGTYELALDNAMWKLHFIAEQLPLVSRQVTISAHSDRQITFPTVVLVQGRTLTGQVTGLIGLQENAPIAHSTLRFFQVLEEEGKKLPTLLGTTVTDAEGKYEIVLPNYDE